MAKQHRMAVLTATCMLSALEPLWGGKGQVIVAGLAVIGVGTLVTVVRRTRNLVRGLRG